MLTQVGHFYEQSKNHFLISGHFYVLRSLLIHLMEFANSKKSWMKNIRFFVHMHHSLTASLNPDVCFGSLFFVWMYILHFTRLQMIILNHLFIVNSVFFACFAFWQIPLFICTLLSATAPVLLPFATRLYCELTLFKHL